MQISGCWIFDNSTGQDRPETYSMAGIAPADFNLAISVMTVTLVLDLLANACLSVVILKGPQLGPVHILILHTCVADVMFGLCCLFPYIAQTVISPLLFSHPLLCKLKAMLQVIPLYSSPFLLTAISIDRYIAICKPLAALKWKYKRVRLLAASAWMASVALALPQLLIFKIGPVTIRQIQKQNGTERFVCALCQAEFGSIFFENLYVVQFTGTAWIAPSLIIAVAYCLVCKAVYRSVEIRRHTSSHGVSGGQNVAAAAANGDASRRKLTNESLLDSQRQLRTRKYAGNSLNKQKIKTVQLTLTIVICNFALFAPFCVTQLLSAFDRHFYLKHQITMSYIMLVGNLNSCVNPWIYLLFNFKQICLQLRGRSCRLMSIYTSQRGHLAAQSRFSTSSDRVDITVTPHVALPSRMSKQNNLANTASNRRRHSARVQFDDVSDESSHRS